LTLRWVGTGATGAAGNLAATHIETNTATVALNEGDVSTAVTKTCASGVLLGGGASLDGTKTAIQSSNPIANGGWSAKAVGTGKDPAVSQTLTVYVVCSGGP
jgi:hypothetical protein